LDAIESAEIAIPMTLNNMAEGEMKASLIISSRSYEFHLYATPSSPSYDEDRYKLDSPENGSFSGSTNLDLARRPVDRHTDSSGTSGSSVERCEASLQKVRSCHFVCEYSR
jgi:hypothetical protein